MQGVGPVAWRRSSREIVFRWGLEIGGRYARGWCEVVGGEERGGGRGPDAGDANRGRGLSRLEEGPADDGERVDVHPSDPRGSDGAAPDANLAGDAAAVRLDSRGRVPAGAGTDREL